MSESSVDGSSVTGIDQTRSRESGTAPGWRQLVANARGVGGRTFGALPLEQAQQELEVRVRRARLALLVGRELNAVRREQRERVLRGPAESGRLTPDRLVAPVVVILLRCRIAIGRENDLVPRRGGESELLCRRGVSSGALRGRRATYSFYELDQGQLVRIDDAGDDDPDLLAQAEPGLHFDFADHLGLGRAGGQSVGLNGASKPELTFVDGPSSSLDANGSASPRRILPSWLRVFGKKI